MSNQLPTDYQAFIHKSRYAKYFDGEGRESWSKTVNRYMENVVDKAMGGVKNSLTKDIEQAILGLEIMPSMRAMMTAGPALDRDNTAGYNCSYLPVDDPKSFDEAMYILLCGTGVGFSPLSASSSASSQKCLSCSRVSLSLSLRTVRKAGLRGSVKFLHSSGLVRFLSGMCHRYALQVQGLKTFGGRASGPAPSCRTV